MSQTRYGRKKRLMGEINVVPYIDVMLVLLVIFMVTAPLLSTGVKVDLPDTEAETIPNEDEEPFVVTVDIDGNLYLNDNKEAVVDPAEVSRQAQAVLARNPELPFLVHNCVSSLDSCAETHVDQVAKCLYGTHQSRGSFGFRSFVARLTPVHFGV